MHATQVPFEQTLFVGQTYPHAPQLFASEFRFVHIPLQQVAPVGQQTTFPQLPQSRLVLPLQARQAATHWFRFFLVGHDRQKAVHRSGLAAQAVESPSVLSAAPAKTTPIVRSESRRDTDTASFFDTSSRRSMIDSSLVSGVVNANRTNPEGIQSFSPGLRHSRYPGYTDRSTTLL
jgi:hypothetical protein